MYFWRLSYPSQMVAKTIDGRRVMVRVIVGSADFIRREAAEAHGHSLETFWPGLKYHIQPLRPDAPELDVAGEEPLRAVQGGVP